MPWVKLDDAFYDHQKTGEAGPMAELLWYRALQWANRNLTDGFIPLHQLRRLGDFEESLGEINYEHAKPGDERWEANRVWCTEMADRLVRARLWTTCEDGRQGWFIHQYDEYQRTADQIRELGGKRSEAGRKGAASRWQDGKPDGNGMANVQQTDGKPIAEPQPEREVPTVRRDTQEGPGDNSWGGTVIELMLTTERSQANGSIRNPRSWDAGVRTRLVSEHMAAIEDLHQRYPDAPAAVIAGHIRGESANLRYYGQPEQGD